MAPGRSRLAITENSRGGSRLVLLNGPDFGLLANGAKGIGNIPRPSFFGIPFGGCD